MPNPPRPVICQLKPEPVVVPYGSTITVQNIIDYGRAHAMLKPLLGIGGITNEPGLSMCNDILGILFSRPFAWKFNRKVMNFFVTQAFIQDYLFAGACAFTLNPVVASGGASSLGGGGVGIGLYSTNPSISGISESGTTVTVQCLQPHNFTVGQTVYMNGCIGPSATAYNATFSLNTNAMTSSWSNGFVITALPTTTSFQFTHTQAGLRPSGAPGIRDFGWMEAAITTDINNNGVPQPTGPIESINRITPTHQAGETVQVAMMADQQNGVLLLRVNPAAGPYSMAVTPVYQQKAPLLTSPTQIWAPWPDNLAYVLRQGFLAMAYRLTDKPDRAEAEFNRFSGAIMSALAFADTENSNEGFAPSVPIMR
jgi:hypothetical protein